MPIGTFARAARQLNDPSQARLALSGPSPEDIYERGEMGNRAADADATRAHGRKLTRANARRETQTHARDTKLQELPPPETAPHSNAGGVQ